MGYTLLPKTKGIPGSGRFFYTREKFGKKGIRGEKIDQESVEIKDKSIV